MKFGEAMESNKPKMTVQKDEFVYEESVNLKGNLTIVIYGLKGSGKTTLGLSFPGKIGILTFDNKTQPIAFNIYPKKDIERFHIVDAVKYYSRTRDDILISSVRTFNYVKKILKYWEKEKFEIDWILFDGLEVLIEIAEMVMRHENNLGYRQGFANTNIWKDRRINLDEIYQLALSVAKKGVIYTTYTSKDEVVENGQFITKKDIPKYFDVIMRDTDVVLRTYSEFKNGKSEFKCEVDSSKIKSFRTGEIIDITNIQNIGINQMLENIL